MNALTTQHSLITLRFKLIVDYVNRVDIGPSYQAINGRNTSCSTYSTCLAVRRGNVVVLVAVMIELRLLMLLYNLLFVEKFFLIVLHAGLRFFNPFWVVWVVICFVYHQASIHAAGSLHVIIRCFRVSSTACLASRRLSLTCGMAQIDLPCVSVP